jgi:hypothetical protein
MVVFISVLHRLSGDGPEAKNSEPEKQTADQRDGEKLWPDHVNSGAAVEDRLRKRYEMR